MIKNEKFWQNIFDMKMNKLSYDQFYKILHFYKIEKKYQSFYIVGTNGKGSIVHLLNQALIKLNFKVGYFISPHINEVNERIVVNNKKIELIDLEHIIQQIFNDFPNVMFGFFNILFLSSLIYFSKFNLDYVIFEAGIGAKKDIVNFLDHDFGILSSIGLDHELILGNTKELVAIDKAHIATKKIILFIPKSIDLKYRNIFIKKMLELNNKSFYLIDNLNIDIYISNIIYVQKIILIIFNAKVNLIYNLSGRMQIIKKNNINFIIDVGHNYEAISNCLKTLKKRKIFYKNILLGISKNKNYESVFNLINKEKNINLYAYQFNYKRSLEIENFPTNFIKIKNLNIFLKNIESNTLIIGSFYLIDEVFKILLK